MSETMDTASNEDSITTEESTTLIAAPVVNPEEHTVNAELWNALTAEINTVVARIDNNEELTPEDVQRVRGLKKEVEDYLTTFNRAMKDAQATYKSLIAKQLESLGYTRIETYIAAQRQKQTNEQNDRLSKKMNTLKTLIGNVLAGTTYVKNTALVGELTSLICVRFPAIKSAAKNKDITNWEPYEAIIKTNLEMLDTFFGDPIFKGAVTLPLSSSTMQQLMKYLRSGDINELREMRVIFARDKPHLDHQKLVEVITSKEVALDIIRNYMNSTDSADNKLANMSKVINIAMTLQE